MSACDECGALTGVHQRGCPADTKVGHAIGKKRRRTAEQTRRWAEICAVVAEADHNQCRRCGSSYMLDCHHKETVQTVLARGGTYDDADTIDNVTTVCRQCHQWIHAGVNFDDAVRLGWLVAEPKLQLPKE